MKIFMMLLLSLSMFFVIACGDDDSGMSENEYLTQSSIQACEKAFECSNELQQVKNSKEECASIKVDNDGGSASVGLKFNGSSAQDCIDCGAELECTKFFNTSGSSTVISNCEACAKLYTAK